MIEPRLKKTLTNERNSSSPDLTWIWPVAVFSGLFTNEGVVGGRVAVRIGVEVSRRMEVLHAHHPK